MSPVGVFSTSATIDCEPARRILEMHGTWLTALCVKNMLAYEGYAGG